MSFNPGDVVTVDFPGPKAIAHEFTADCLLIEVHLCLF
jgi:uncharacterized protein YodC (DUF2158 family)